MATAYYSLGPEMHSHKIKNKCYQISHGKEIRRGKIYIFTCIHIHIYMCVYIHVCVQIAMETKMKRNKTGLPCCKNSLSFSPFLCSLQHLHLTPCTHKQMNSLSEAISESFPAPSASSSSLTAAICTQEHYEKDEFF